MVGLATRQTVSIKKAGTIFPDASIEERQPYEHQKEAMHCLDTMDRLPSFSTMVVLPTGGGKTYTASNWLLRHAINKHKKVLWIAHRHMLLDQAAESFARFASANALTDIGSFDYRIVSGATWHCKVSEIRPSDTLVVASKDSLGSKSAAKFLDGWLRGQQELYLIVDEAHHAAAKTYRSLIEHLQNKVPYVKVIGLTATPLRTAEREQGILSQIFPDGIDNGRPRRGYRGITYQIGLQDLINRQILARPVMNTFESGETFGQELSAKDLDLMVKRDKIPNSVAEKIVESAARNKLIVDTYVQNKDVYGQTLVFAVNINHAFVLDALFKKAGVRSGCVVSEGRNCELSSSEYRSNQQVIDAFKNGDLDVLVNVNILTEGTDLPKTQTVFLARPTSSTVLMTQMVGRALRGIKAGGTAEANIVSFVDGWGDRVAWTNPTTLFTANNDVDHEREETPQERRERMESDLQAISLAKLAEFAQLADSMVNTELLERVPFIQRIPVGMYVFSYIEQPDVSEDGTQVIEGSDISCQVMVYSSNEESYKHLLDALPGKVHELGLDDEEFTDDDTMDKIVSCMEKECFDPHALPPHRTKDIEAIAKYFLQFGQAPSFYPFDTIDRARLDVGAIARHIDEMDFRRSEQTKYLNELWDAEDENLLKLFFARKEYFLHAVELELRKIEHPDTYGTAVPVTCNMPEVQQSQEELDPITWDGAESEPHVGQKDADKHASDKVAVRPVLPIQGRQDYDVPALHPASMTYEALPPYVSAGIARNRMTGLPIKKFGGKARIMSAGNTTTLFCHGYRAAEYSEATGVRLLSYELEGKHHGWDENPHVFLAVQDFVASNLNLNHAPSHEDLETMSQDPSSHLRIEAVSLSKPRPPIEPSVFVRPQTTNPRPAAAAPKPPAAITANPLSKAAKPLTTAVEPPATAAAAKFSNTPARPQVVSATSKPVTARSLTTAVSPAHIKPTQQASSSASVFKRPQTTGQSASLSGAGKGVRYNDIKPVPWLTQEEFEMLKPASTSAEALKNGWGKHARVLSRNGIEYLYIDRLQIAEWSTQNGLTLYEYKYKDGTYRTWKKSDMFPYVADFVVKNSGLRKNAVESSTQLSHAIRTNPKRFHDGYIRDFVPGESGPINLETE